MRKITETVSQALIDGKKKTVSNTASNGNSISLHGNKIIEKKTVFKIGASGLKTKTFFNLRGSVSPKGRPTPTTRERLNGYLYLIGASFGFGQKNWEPVLHGRNDQNEYVVRPVNDNTWYSFEELKEIINS